MPRTAEIPGNHIVSFKVTDGMRELLLCEARRYVRSLAEIVNQTFRLWFQQHAPVTAKKLSRTFARKEHQNQPVQSICHENS
jgi:hypothetical protein